MSLAMAMASSSVVKVSTVITGPKPSSVTAWLSEAHWSRMVGA